MSNLFHDLPDARDAEQLEVLLTNPAVRIERIVSQGQRSPDGFWYDQQDTEWVILLQGAARLRFELDDRIHELQRGDHVLIPARARHRVDWTAPGEVTIWLAVFFSEGASETAAESLPVG